MMKRAGDPGKELATGVNYCQDYCGDRSGRGSTLTQYLSRLANTAWQKTWFSRQEINGERFVKRRQFVLADMREGIMLWRILRQSLGAIYAAKRCDNRFSGLHPDLGAAEVSIIGDKHQRAEVLCSEHFD